MDIPYADEDMENVRLIARKYIKKAFKDGVEHGKWKMGA